MLRVQTWTCVYLGIQSGYVLGHVGQAIALSIHGNGHFHLHRCFYKDIISAMDSFFLYKYEELSSTFV